MHLYYTAANNLFPEHPPSVCRHADTKQGEFNDAGNQYELIKCCLLKLSPIVATEVKGLEP